MGVISGAKIIAPITVGVESWKRPMVASRVLKIIKTIKTEVVFDPSFKLISVSLMSSSLTFLNKGMFPSTKSSSISP